MSKGQGPLVSVTIDFADVSREVRDASAENQLSGYHDLHSLAANVYLKPLQDLREKLRETPDVSSVAQAELSTFADPLFDALKDWAFSENGLADATQNIGDGKNGIYKAYKEMLASDSPEDAKRKFIEYCAAQRWDGNHVEKIAALALLDIIDGKPPQDIASSLESAVKTYNDVCAAQAAKDASRDRVVLDLDDKTIITGDVTLLTKSHFPELTGAKINFLARVCDQGKTLAVMNEITRPPLHDKIYGQMLVPASSGGISICLKKDGDKVYVVSSVLHRRSKDMDGNPIEEYDSTNPKHGGLIKSSIVYDITGLEGESFEWGFGGKSIPMRLSIEGSEQDIKDLQIPPTLTQEMTQSDKALDESVRSNIALLDAYKLRGAGRDNDVAGSALTRLTEIDDDISRRKKSALVTVSTSIESALRSVSQNDSDTNKQKAAQVIAKVVDELNFSPKERYSFLMAITKKEGFKEPQYKDLLLEAAFSGMGRSAESKEAASIVGEIYETKDSANAEQLAKVKSMALMHDHGGIDDKDKIKALEFIAKVMPEKDRAKFMFSAALETPVVNDPRALASSYSYYAAYCDSIAKGSMPNMTSLNPSARNLIENRDSKAEFPLQLARAMVDVAVYRGDKANIPKLGDHLNTVALQSIRETIDKAIVDKEKVEALSEVNKMLLGGDGLFKVALEELIKSGKASEAVIKAVADHALSKRERVGEFKRFIETKGVTPAAIKAVAEVAYPNEESRRVELSKLAYKENQESHPQGPAILAAAFPELDESVRGHVAMVYQNPTLERADKRIEAIKSDVAPKIAQAANAIIEEAPGLRHKRELDQAKQDKEKGVSVSAENLALRLELADGKPEIVAGEVVLDEKILVDKKISLIADISSTIEGDPEAKREFLVDQTTAMAGGWAQESDQEKFDLTIFAAEAFYPEPQERVKFFMNLASQDVIKEPQVYVGDMLGQMVNDQRHAEVAALAQNLETRDVVIKSLAKELESDGKINIQAIATIARNITDSKENNKFYIDLAAECKEEVSKKVFSERGFFAQKTSSVEINGEKWTASPEAQIGRFKIDAMMRMDAEAAPKYAKENLVKYFASSKMFQDKDVETVKVDLTKKRNAIIKSASDAGLIEPQDPTKLTTKHEVSNKSDIKFDKVKKDQMKADVIHMLLPLAGADQQKIADLENVAGKMVRECAELAGIKMTVGQRITRIGDVISDGFHKLFKTEKHKREQELKALVVTDEFKKTASDLRGHLGKNSVTSQGRPDSPTQTPKLELEANKKRSPGAFRNTDLIR